MSKTRKLLLWSLAILVVLMALGYFLTRGHKAELSLDEVSGTDPVLAEPESEIFPTIRISEPIGWKADQTPIAAEGLKVQRFASDLDHPRVLYALPNGDILVALTRGPKFDDGGFTAWIAEKLMSRAGAAGASANTIMLLRDEDGDGAAEVKIPLIQGLDSPSGIAWVGAEGGVVDADAGSGKGAGTLYITNHNALLSFPYVLGGKTAGERKKLLDLPAGTGHWMRNIIADPTGEKLFITVGSESNAGENGMEAETKRAAIWEYVIDGGGQRIYASGLRNPNGLDWNPWSEELWTTVNERDMLGSDLVPDYLTNVPLGVQYGWPWVYYRDNIDRRVKAPMPNYLIEYSRRPEYALGPHVAALGLSFTRGGHRMGTGFARGAFIARHGSWNRRPAAGYDVVFVGFDERGNPLDAKPIPVLSGFLVKEGEKTGDGAEEGDVRGRPTWTAFAKDGALLVSDDTSGIIWRVIAPDAAPSATPQRKETTSLPPVNELKGDPADAFTDEFARQIQIPTQ